MVTKGPSQILLDSNLLHPFIMTLIEKYGVSFDNISLSTLLQNLSKGRLSVMEEVIEIHFHLVSCLINRRKTGRIREQYLDKLEVKNSIGSLKELGGG